MKRIAVSITAHQNLACLVNKIANLRVFLPDCIVVVHLSREWREGYLSSSLRAIPNVYINPNRLHTEWGLIVHCQKSNFEYLASQTTFDCFLMDSSNTLYFKSGFQDWIEDHDCALATNEFNSDYDFTQPHVRNYNRPCLDDSEFNSLLTTHNWTTRIASQHDGTFFSYTHFSTMCQLLDEHKFDLARPRNYPLIEYLFPTIFYNLFGNSYKRGYPAICIWHRSPTRATIEYLLNDPQGRQTPCFGIKKIRDDINDPVRNYITYELKKVM